MILNDEGKKEFLKSSFHPFFNISLTANFNEGDVIQFVNYTLPLSEIKKKFALEDFTLFNDDYNNVFFTTDDDQFIYRYEFYRGVYFIRMNPFRKNIKMHIVPKKYDASDGSTENAVLIFRDNKTSGETNVFLSNEYIRDPNGTHLNLQYQEDTKVSSYGYYRFGIKKAAKNFKAIQVNIGYSYNDTNPTNEIKHYTGIIDASDHNGTLISDPSDYTEFNNALMAANYDNVSSYTNVSKMKGYENGEIKWPTDTTPYYDGKHTKGFNNTHGINNLHHQIIKYFNDDIYIEENKKYINQSWIEGGS